MSFDDSWRMSVEEGLSLKRLPYLFSGPVPRIGELMTYPIPALTLTVAQGWVSEVINEIDEAGHNTPVIKVSKERPLIAEIASVTVRKGDALAVHMSHPNFFRVEIDREEDGRWIADVPDLPGVLVYGATRDAAIRDAEALALEVLAGELRHGERTGDSIPLFHVVL